MLVSSPRLRGSRAVAAAALALVAGCATSDQLVGLSIATTGTTAPQVGEAVALVVRALYDDGSSAEITDRATCRVEGDAAVGALAGAVFTAAAPGAVTIVCDYVTERASLAMTVAGMRVVTIAAIQRGEVAVATPVEVEGVVFALAPDAGFTDFWMQDVGGGPYSGIYVRDGRAAGSPAAAEGDRVRVSGVTNERNGRSVVELDAVTTVGTATPTVDTVALAELDAARWDGCLVSVADVVVTNPAVDDYTWEVAAAAAPDGARVLVDTLLHDVQPAAGQAFARITGPIFPFLATGGPAVAIVPRRAEDLGGSGTAATTPFDLHDGTIAPGREVTLDGLVITAIDHVDRTTQQVDLYAQAPAGGAGAGVFLRDVRTAPTAPPAVGDRVMVAGVFDIVRGRATVSYGALQVTGTATVVPTSIDIATDELPAYESVLVVATTLRVSQAMVDAYSYEVEDDRSGGTAKVRVDQSLYDPLPRAGDRYDALTGVVFRGTTYASIAPRTAADVELW